jgi:hypothetical protein
MNAQNDGKNRLRRMEFIFNGQSFKLALNPEEYEQSQPSRVTITQTKGGAWVDDWGAGIANISMKGTTGWKNGTGDPTSGFKKFRELQAMVEAYYTKLPPGATIPADKEMIFHNYTDEQHYVVIPKVFRLFRSVARPLLYQYQIELMCQRDASAPASRGASVEIKQGRVQ